VVGQGKGGQLTVNDPQAFAAFAAMKDLKTG
jgi:hypothetical protein